MKTFKQFLSEFAQGGGDDGGGGGGAPFSVVHWIHNHVNYHRHSDDKVTSEDNLYNHYEQHCGQMTKDGEAGFSKPVDRKSFGGHLHRNNMSPAATNKSSNWFATVKGVPHRSFDEADK